VKKKSTQIEILINELHLYIVNSPLFRKNTTNKSETEIQTEIRPIILNFLEKYFASKSYKDAKAKANKSFYWEGQEGKYGRSKSRFFGGRNYPDFIITDPYLIAIEYKKSETPSLVKQGFGQAIMHTMSEEFDFVYYLFQDESKDKYVVDSIKNDSERMIIRKMWDDFNVYFKII